MQNFYDSILSLFTDEDIVTSAHVKLSKPHCENGFVYSTDGRSLVIVPVSSLASTYDKVDGYPDVKGRVVDVAKTKLLKEPQKIQTNALAEILNNLEREPIHPNKECPNCDGSGIEICLFCDSEGECSKCDGEGEIVDTENEIGADYAASAVVDIGGIYYLPKYLERLLKVAEVNDNKVIEILTHIPDSANIFKTGEVEIVLMPMNRDGVSRNEEYKISQLNEVEA